MTAAPVRCRRLWTRHGVVDDATVVGERVHAFELEGMAPREAAIRGTSEVSVPVIFGVLTTLNKQQAMDRAGGKLGNKGEEAALTAIKMLAF